MLKKIILITIILIAGNCFAYPISPKDSGPFFIPGGILLPRDTDNNPGVFNLNLTNLPKGNVYEITCDLDNPNYHKDYPVIIGIPKAGVRSINGNYNYTNQYKLNLPLNKYRAIIENNGNLLQFLNYDDTDAIYIKNCIALYATQE